MIVLIDGDSLVYKAAFASQQKVGDTIVGDPPYRTCQILDLMIKGITKYLSSNSIIELKIYLTSNDKSNFRYKIDETYKENRKTQQKPINYDVARQHLFSKGATLVKNQEADDALIITANLLKEHNKVVIVHEDKDIDQYNGLHLNYWKKPHPRMYYIKKIEALKNFYRQILTGDRVDNIPGLPGFGPAKAGKLINSLETEQQMFKITRDTYIASGCSDDYLLKQGRLVKIRQYKDEMWEFPIINNRRG